MVRDNSSRYSDGLPPTARRLGTGATSAVGRTLAGMRILERTVTIDAADLDAEAAFWAAVFQGDAVGDDEYREVRAADGSSPIGVQRAPGLPKLDWPAQPVRAHLDLVVADIDAAHQEVVDLGAIIVQRRPGGETFNVYRSPSGHPFCLCWSPESES